MKFKKIFIPISLVCVFVVCSIAALTQIRPSAEELSIQSIQGIVGNFTSDEGSMDAVLYSITLDTAEEIDSQIAEQQSANLASDYDGNVGVVYRSWTTYSYSQATALMTDAERQFYYRLDSLAQAYITDSTLDAYYVSTYNLYTMNGVQYADLGLTGDDAFYVAEWFLYNNPQYYFMKPSFLITASSLYPSVHDIFYDGDYRANVTNTMFATLDSWIAQISDTEVTAYEKELAAHTLLCENLTYVKGNYDQSIYSAIMERQTVCAGYSQTMTAMLNYVGVPTCTIFSTNHAWNKVLLDDGLYYAVDVTWDDTLSGTYLLNCNDTDIAKYDLSNEHVVSPDIAKFAPATSPLSMASHVVEYANVNAPSNVRYENVTATSVRILWDAVDGADYYELQAFSDASCTSSLGYLQSRACSAKITGISTGNSIYVKVRACRGTTNEIVYSDWTDALCATAVDPTPSEPTPIEQPQVSVNAPTNLHPEDTTTTSVRVVWDGVEGASSYYIEVYTDSSMNSMILGRGISGTSVKLTGMTPGASRYIRLRADSSVNGLVYSSDWVTLTVTTNTDNTTPAPQETVSGDSSSDTSEEPMTETPPAPVLSAPSATPCDITENSGRITWSSVEGATGYVLEVSFDSNFSSIAARKTLSFSSSRLKLTKLLSGTTYYVRLKAYNADCESEWSTVSFTTNSAAPVVLAAPSVTTERVSSSSYRIRWSTVENATSYTVEVYSNSSYTTLLASKTLTGSSLKLTGLGANRTYYVRVRACGDTNSDWTNTSFVVR